MLGTRRQKEELESGKEKGIIRHLERVDCTFRAAVMEGRATPHSSQLGLGKSADLVLLREVLGLRRVVYDFE